MIIYEVTITASGIQASFLVKKVSKKRIIRALDHALGNLNSRYLDGVLSNPPTMSSQEAEKLNEQVGKLTDLILDIVAIGIPCGGNYFGQYTNGFTIGVKNRRVW